MRGRERLRAALAGRVGLVALARLVALVALAAGCAHSPAPRGWSDPPMAARTSGYGGWIRLVMRPEVHGGLLEGELIAVTDDSVFVLAQERLRGAPLGAVRDGRLAAYDPESGGPALWTLLGTVSTLSHGWGFLLTAPAWIVTGSLLTASTTRTPLYDVPGRSWWELRPFARFPQGLPVGLDRAALRPKRGP